jgi:hypothetical protein
MFEYMLHIPQKQHTEAIHNDPQRVRRVVLRNFSQREFLQLFPFHFTHLPSCLPSYRSARYVGKSVKFLNFLERQTQQTPPCAMKSVCRNLKSQKNESMFGSVTLPKWLSLPTPPLTAPKAAPRNQQL